MTDLLRKVVCILLCVFSFSLASNAQDEIIFNKCPIDDTPDAPPIYDVPSRGNRIPGHRIVAYIDWEASKLEFNADVDEDIVSYELWQDGVCIFCIDDSCVLVDTLRSVQSSQIIVVINMSEYLLFGYFDPDTN